MTKEQLIKESIERGFINGTYIDNSEFEGAYGKTHISNDKNYELAKYVDYDKYYFRVGGDKVWSDGVWAKILKYSDNYKPPQENLLSNLIIW